MANTRNRPGRFGKILADCSEKELAAITIACAALTDAKDELKAAKKMISKATTLNQAVTDFADDFQGPYLNAAIHDLNNIYEYTKMRLADAMEDYRVKSRAHNLAVEKVCKAHAARVVAKAKKQTDTKNWVTTTDGEKIHITDEGYISLDVNAARNLLVAVHHAIQDFEGKSPKARAVIHFKSVI